MTSDDKETKPFQADPLEQPDEESEVPRARPRAPAPRAVTASRWLALIPVTAAVLVFLLMVPRGTTPEDVPLPIIDGRAIRATEAEDDARAAAARQTRLSTAVLAVGGAMRDLNRSMAVRDDETMGVSRRRLDDALRGVNEIEGKNAGDALRTLRAVQLEGFLAEVRTFESTGTPSKELGELGGGFVERMTDAGWVTGHTVLLTDAQRRVAYKLVWTALVFGDRIPELTLTLDEQRVLYTLYLTLPHVPDAQRISYQLMRRNAATPDECHTVALKERFASEMWRADKIRKLGELDSSYPAGYALGIAYYRAGRYDESMNAFHAWMESHPDGPLAARARNYWKAAWLANGADMIRALLVDDDPDLARLLVDYLASHEVTITHVLDGPKGLDALERDVFDVVLLDVMLPGIDGFEVCRRIRAKHEVPIVMLTARGDDTDRIVGLEIGADDYVPKPFNPRELLARMRAVLRRARPPESVARPSREILTVGPLEIDLAARVTKKDGAEVPLTSFEYRILVVLARRVGETVTREELASEVREPVEVKAKGGSYDPSVDRSLDVHVSRLRQKLEADPKEPRLIKTVRGVGYVLSRPA